MSTKILLADDSITIQKVIGIIFGGDEFSLTIVDNGRAALEKACEIPPDIFLIDALMPGMSGYEVCEQIRGIPELASKPILLLTGSFEPFDETKAKKCGADGYISKPFESQQIITKVSELCNRGPVPTPVAEPAVSQPVTLETPAIVELAPEAPTAAPEPPGAFPQRNIWDAFTPAEPPAVPEVAIQDVFEQTAFDETQPLEKHADSPWGAVEETTFEFEEVSAADVISNTEIDAQEEEEEIFVPDAPPPISASIPSTELPAQTHSTPAEIAAAPEAISTGGSALAQPATPLTEDQLREVLSGVSREVIERIVWEVVPDLAEVLIKEAIRQITEGRV